MKPSKPLDPSSVCIWYQGFRACKVHESCVGQRMVSLKDWPESWRWAMHELGAGRGVRHETGPLLTPGRTDAWWAVGRPGGAMCVYRSSLFYSINKWWWHIIPMVTEYHRMVMEMSFEYFHQVSNMSKHICSLMGSAYWKSALEQDRPAGRKINEV